MGSWLTKAEMREELSANLGNRLQTNTTRLDRFVRLGELWIARKHDFQEMQKDSVYVRSVGPIAVVNMTWTVTSDTTYVPRSVFSVLWHVGASSVPTEEPVRLRNVTQRQWDQILGLPHYRTPGDPTHYMYTAGTMYFWPVPNREWYSTLKYSIWPVAASSSSELENKDDLIVAVATHFAFQSLGMREDAAMYFAMAKDMLKDAIESDAAIADRAVVPRGIVESSMSVVDPWADPFVRGSS